MSKMTSIEPSPNEPDAANTNAAITLVTSGIHNAEESLGGGFVAWAKQLTAGTASGGVVDDGKGGGSGWKAREGGLQSVADSFGAHNSAGMRQAEME